LAARRDTPGDGNDQPQPDQSRNGRLDQSRLEGFTRLDFPVVASLAARELRVDKQRRQPRVDERNAVRLRIGPKNPRLAEPARENREKELWPSLGNLGV